MDHEVGMTRVMPDGKYLLIKAVSVTLMNDDTDRLGVQCMNKTGWKNKCKSRTPENFHAVSRHSFLNTETQII